MIFCTGLLRDNVYETFLGHELSVRVALAGINVSLTVSSCPRQCVTEDLKPYVQVGKAAHLVSESH